MRHTIYIYAALGEHAVMERQLRQVLGDNKTDSNDDISYKDTFTFAGIRCRFEELYPETEFTLYNYKLTLIDDNRISESEYVSCSQFLQHLMTDRLNWNVIPMQAVLDGIEFDIPNPASGFRPNEISRVCFELPANVNIAGFSTFKESVFLLNDLKNEIEGTGLKYHCSFATSRNHFFHIPNHQCNNDHFLKTVSDELHTSGERAALHLLLSVSNRSYNENWVRISFIFRAVISSWEPQIEIRYYNRLYDLPYHSNINEVINLVQAKLNLKLAKAADIKQETIKLYEETKTRRQAVKHINAFFDTPLEYETTSYHDLVAFLFNTLSSHCKINRIELWGRNYTLLSAFHFNSAELLIELKANCKYDSTLKSITFWLTYSNDTLSRAALKLSTPYFSPGNNPSEKIELEWFSYHNAVKSDDFQTTIFSALNATQKN